MNRSDEAGTLLGLQLRIVINLFLRTTLFVGFLLYCALSEPVRAQEAHSIGRRVADIATVAVSEYGEGVVGGRVVRPEELDEARLFIAEAQGAAEGLPAGLRDRVLAHLRTLAALQQQIADVTALEEELARLRGSLAEGLGIALDQFPSRAASLAVGARVFATACAQCHGQGGRGDGTAAVGLEPPPTNLVDGEALRGASPIESFRKVNVGVAGTAMPGFEAQLSLDERWAVTLYAAALRHDADRAEGQRVLSARCSDCDLFVSDLELTARLSDDSLAALLVSIGRFRSGDDLRAMIAFARIAAAREYLGADRALALRRTVRETKEALASVVVLAEDGRRAEAARATLDAYLVFEGIETRIRAQDAAVVRRVEEGFANLRAAVAVDGMDVRPAYDDVIVALEAAGAGVSKELAPQGFFVQSFIILVREGLEAILIVGALVAFLTRAGAADRRRDIGRGVVWALVASGVTALGFATIFRTAAAHQEVLEGVTMLLAATVLFVVSYWLVSKIEVEKWTAFVRARMSTALTSGRSWALAGVAFLAVYREGFETVLFYAALLSTAQGAVPALSAIIAGFVTGAAALGLVYLGMLRWGLRIPLRPFFAVTSTLLYVMAFSFAGQGIAELQEVGWVGMTPLKWVPAIPALGIFPTLQTLSGQALLAMALVGALVWIFWVEPRGARVQAST